MPRQHPLAHVATRQSFACHCEERSDVAIRIPAETGRNKQDVGRIRGRLRICLKCCFSLCATARRTDCHVASLLAMTRGRDVLAPAHTSFLQHVIANQCAHWCGNPRPRRGAWQAGCCFGKSAAPLVFAQSIPFRHVLPQRIRIATSLRSSQ